MAKYIEIEDDIPMPEDTEFNKYPWFEMKVGQSFLVPGKQKKII